MFWYLLLAIFPIVLMPVINTFYKSTIYENDKAKRMYLFWCGVAIFLMIGLRHNTVGSADSYNYYSNWAYLSTLSFDDMLIYVPGHEMESGYLYTVWALSQLFTNPQFLFIFTGAFFALSVCMYVYKNSKEPAISIVMFISLGLYTFMAQGLRQAIAMAICLFAFEYCKKKKPIQFLLLIYVATCFHTSAIAYIPIYLLSYVKLNTLSYIGTAGLGVLLLVFSDTLINLANQWYGSEYYQTVDSGGFVAVAIYVITIVLALIFQKNYSDKKNYDLLFLVTFYGAIFYSMRYIGGLIAGRVSWYYMFGQLILLPNVVSSMEKRTKEVVSISVLILAVLLFAYRLHDSNLIPFKFFWQ